MKKIKKKRFGFDVLLLVVLISFILGSVFTVTIPKLFPSRPGRAWVGENLQEASVNIAAVRSDGAGTIASLTVRVSLGEGRILIDTHPLIGFDFQYADRTAVEVAARLTGISLDDDGVGLKGADVLFIVSTSSGGSVEIQAIDGPSAGAATTVATIAAIENKRVREDIVITGTINSDGSIGPIGGIFQKAQAANDLGASLFLVPKGQSVVTMYREVVRQVGPWQWLTYEPVTIDLNRYAENVGWGIRVREVSTINEVLVLMLETEK